MAPKNAKLLHQVGSLALFAGETEADVLRNAAARKTDPEWPDIRHSLFLLQSLKGGKKVWRLVLTSDGAWKAAADMNAWCKDQARNVRKCFVVMNARSSDRRNRRERRSGRTATEPMMAPVRACHLPNSGNGVWVLFDSSSFCVSATQRETWLRALIDRARGC